MSCVCASDTHEIRKRKRGHNWRNGKVQFVLKGCRKQHNKLHHLAYLPAGQGTFYPKFAKTQSNRHRYHDKVVMVNHHSAAQVELQNAPSCGGCKYPWRGSRAARVVRQRGSGIPYSLHPRSVVDCRLNNRDLPGSGKSHR